MSNPEPVRTRWAWFGAGWAVALATGIWLGLNAAPPDRVTFLAVGQGDCAVIESEGRTILIDDGPQTPTFDAASSIIRPRLREMGIAQIDLILLSHPDMDHVGGTPTLLQAFPDAKVGVSAYFAHNAEMTRRLEAWRLPPERIAWLPSELTGVIGDLWLRISCPSISADEKDVNRGSMFVRCGRGRVAVVFTGDAPMETEDREIANGDWSASVLKAGHHGSRTATGSEWLLAVHPQWVIISCGRDNRYGHPNREALARIQAAGAQIARTDREGDIQFQFEGDRLVRVRA